MIRKFPHRFVRFGTIGLATNGALYLIFVLLAWAGLPPMAATALCYVVGLMLSYFLNRSWSFQSSNSHSRDAPKFLLAYGAGFLATMVFMSLLLRVLRPEIAQFLNIGLTAIVIYGGLALTRFGQAGDRCAN